MPEYNPNLTIEEIREKKRIMTEYILKFITEFQEETGVKINSIHLKQEDVYNYGSEIRLKSFVTEIAVETSIAD